MLGYHFKHDKAWLEMRTASGFEIVASVRNGLYVACAVLTLLVLVPFGVFICIVTEFHPLNVVVSSIFALAGTGQLLFFCLGKMVVWVSRDRGLVFTGVGRVGIYRSFRPKEIDGVEAEDTWLTRIGRGMFSGFGVNTVRIVLVGERLIKFGGARSAEQMQAMIDALQERLETR